MAEFDEWYLLVDVSNSYTKWCVASDKGIRGVKRLLTVDITAQWVRGVVKGSGARGIYLSSVVPKVTGIFRSVGRDGVAIKYLRGTSRLPILVDYPQPGKVGADRIANAIAAYYEYGGPCVVIDFGTAVTFDVVSADGAYAGGVIAPGLNVMTEYLHEKTALLPLVRLKEPRRAVGKSTVEAIRAGALYGYRGMIVEILKKIAAELRSKDVKVIATGGQADIVVRRIKGKIEIDPQLTLTGLWIWARFLRGVLS